MSNMIFNIKGEILFIFDANKNLFTQIIQIENKLNIFPEEIREAMKERLCSQIVYDLVKGEDFVKMVDSGCITDDDGRLVNIFVDGFDSNLGLYDKNFSQGDFLLTKKMFLNICKKYEVLVNWANK